MLGRGAEKGQMSKTDAAMANARIQVIETTQGFADCQIVIEAATENPDIKNNIYQDLEGLMAENAIIATNTSSLSITTLASPLKNPERFVGMHFFNPVPLMPLVEIIRHEETSDRTVDIAKYAADKMGKTRKQLIIDYRKVNEQLVMLAYPLLRVDDAFEEGMDIPIYYDPMIAKLVVWAKDRDTCIEKCIRAINDYQISGVKTTLDFGIYVLKHDAFKSGDFDTNFVKLHLPDVRLIPESMTDEGNALMGSLNLIWTDLIETKNKDFQSHKITASWKNQSNS